MSNCCAFVWVEENLQSVHQVKESGFIGIITLYELGRLGDGVYKLSSCYSWSAGSARLASPQEPRVPPAVNSNQKKGGTHSITK